MSLENIEIIKADERAIDQLRSFIPDMIFDVHAHLYDSSYAPNFAAPGSIFHECGEIVTVTDYKRLQSPLYGDNKKIRLNIVTIPDVSMVDLSNGRRAASTQFLKGQLDEFPECVGEVFVLPEDSVSDIEAQLVHPNIRGFKCYHVCAKKKPTWQSDIGAYLPESAWIVANKRSFCMTLHMVKDRALSDPENLAYIQRMCQKYPNAKLILAHCARGFAAWTVMNSVRLLRDYDNIYYDMAAVCESPPIFELIKTAGVKKVLWGSDFPISMMRGKCVSIADQFLWIYQKQYDLCQSMPPLNLNLVGVEGLLAFQQTAQMLDLSNQDIEDIFYHNAMNLFHLTD